MRTLRVFVAKNATQSTSKQLTKTCWKKQIISKSLSGMSHS